jgi:hypothetical protein
MRAQSGKIARPSVSAMTPFSLVLINSMFDLITKQSVTTFSVEVSFHSSLYKKSSYSRSDPCYEGKVARMLVQMLLVTTSANLPKAVGEIPKTEVNTREK